MANRMDSGWCLLLFVVVLCRCAEAVEYAKYKDPSQLIDARVDDLLARMTLEEKIGQMTQIERTVATADVMKNYYIGSVLSGGGSEPAPQASPATWINMVDGLQKSALSTRLQIPMIYGIDAVHGHNNVYGATIFPHNIGLGATRQVEYLLFSLQDNAFKNDVGSVVGCKDSRHHISPQWYDIVHFGPKPSWICFWT